MVHSNDELLAFVPNILDRMRSHKFMLAYRGFFSQEITKALVATTEKKLELEGTEFAIKKRVFNVMVECLQNICKHKDEINGNTALFMIGRSGSDFIVYSGNVVATDKVTGLTNKLEAINSMEATDLKDFHKALIASGELSEDGGAGLGLIDIAKKSGSKFDFHFDRIDDSFSYFSLRTIIKSVKAQ